VAVEGNWYAATVGIPKTPPEVHDCIIDVAKWDVPSRIGWSTSPRGV